MEGYCFDSFRKKVNVSNFYDNGGGYVHKSNDTVREIHLHLSDSKLKNAATTTAHIYTLLASMFDKKQMIRGVTIWYQTGGCAKQYRCSIAYYLMSFLSKTYQNFLGRSVDTTGHGKHVVDGFNAVQKRYSATCLRMRSTTEVDKIDIKRIRFDSMTKKGEVSFAEEYNHLLYLRDVISPRVIRNMRIAKLNHA